MPAGNGAKPYCVTTGCNAPQTQGGRYPDGLCVRCANEWCEKNPRLSQDELEAKVQALGGLVGALLHLTRTMGNKLDAVEDALLAYAPLHPLIGTSVQMQQLTFKLNNEAVRCLQAARAQDEKPKLQVVDSSDPQT